MEVNTLPICMVQSDRKPGLYYTLTFHHDIKKVICSCPDFSYRKRPGDMCKHIKLVKVAMTTFE